MDDRLARLAQQAGVELHRSRRRGQRAERRQLPLPRVVPADEDREEHGDLARSRPSGQVVGALDDRPELEAERFGWIRESVGQIDHQHSQWWQELHDVITSVDGSLGTAGLTCLAAIPTHIAPPSGTASAPTITVPSEKKCSSTVTAPETTADARTRAAR